MATDEAGLRQRVDAVWEAAILPTLHDYIRIPAVSVAYDAGWREHGHVDAAVDLAAAWVRARPIAGLQVSVLRPPDLTPLLLCEVAPFGGAGADDTVLLYGHLDKQPPMSGWREGLGPWEPVLDGDRLYGRGGADDGYAVFAALTAIEAVQAAGGRHARCVVVVECSEESGSPDLPAHLAALGDRLGEPSLVVCLDSGCGGYDRLWVTTSLRGNLIGELRVDVLTEGVHSGGAGGVVPSSFRVLRRLLDRVEDPDTGELLLPELTAEVPAERRDALTATAHELGDALDSYPWVEGARSPWTDPAAKLLARTWQGSLSVTGIDGVPPGEQAGNVLRPWTSATLSFRLPPTTDADAAADALTRVFEAAPPHGTHVRFAVHSAERGWDAPATAPWLAAATDAASHAAFGTGTRSIGEGGSIPFMAMLGLRFPEAQFLVTGVLGPGSNAHGPNEFLHVDMARRLTQAVALVLDADARRTT